MNASLSSRLASGLLVSALLLGAVPRGLAAEDSAPPPKPAVDFARDIQPILAEHCLACHGPEKGRGGFRLTSRAATLAATDSGTPAVVPGQPEASELFRRLTTTDLDERMPPRTKEPLKSAEIAKLRHWIAEGVAWTEHWAWQPLSHISPPPVRNSTWVRNAVDRFVLARLEEKRIAPSPEADRYTLIKRLYYDLLGLPPPLEEVDAFVHDRSPDAYAKLVERLLASPHFGERWGRHWLDLAPYADSDGYEKDRARPDAYVYRDWVIAALNDDVPTETRFLQETGFLESSNWPGTCCPGPRPGRRSRPPSTGKRSPMRRGAWTRKSSAWPPPSTAPRRSARFGWA
jgi:mono/diheme cytochrome c family protein